MIHVIGLTAAPLTDRDSDAAQLIHHAPLVLGYPRQLALVEHLVTGQSVALHSPLRTTLRHLLETAPTDTVVLASGDPLFHGIGETVIDCAPAGVRVRCYPTSTAASLAASEMGWSYSGLPVFSLTTEPLQALCRELSPGQRLLIYGITRQNIEDVAGYLCRHGYDSSRLWLLGDLGTPSTSRWQGTAKELSRSTADAASFCGDVTLLAMECQYCDPRDSRASRTAGLPDELFSTDKGQLTKQAMRAITLSQLLPCAGEELWDVGAGSGSVAIEWCRLTGGTAHCFEAKAARHRDIVDNTERLGVTGLTLHGEAPTTFAEVTTTPAAIFIGGGVTTPGIVAACWERLMPGGRLVATAVTTESLRVVEDACARYGGCLTEYSEATYSPLGHLHTWRPRLRHVQWVVEK